MIITISLTFESFLGICNDEQFMMFFTWL